MKGKEKKRRESQGRRSISCYNTAQMNTQERRHLVDWQCAVEREVQSHAGETQLATRLTYSED